MITRNPTLTERSSGAIELRTELPMFFSESVNDPPRITTASQGVEAE